MVDWDLAKYWCQILVISADSSRHHYRFMSFIWNYPQICWRKHIRLRVMGWHSVVWWLPKLDSFGGMMWHGSIMRPSSNMSPTCPDPSNEQVGVHVDVRNTNWEDHPKTSMTVYIPFVSWLTTSHFFHLPTYWDRTTITTQVPPGSVPEAMPRIVKHEAAWLLCFPGLWRQPARNPRGMVEMRMSQNLQERNPMIYHSLSCYRGSTTMHHHLPPFSGSCLYRFDVGRATCWPPAEPPGWR